MLRKRVSVLHVCARQGILLKLWLRKFMFHRVKKKIKWMEKNPHGWKEGLSLLLWEEGNVDCAGHLSWRVSLVSPPRVTG